MTGDQLDSKLDMFGPVHEADQETTAAAVRYIRRRALNPQDAELLLDALLGPLGTHPAGFRPRRDRARGAA